VEIGWRGRSIPLFDVATLVGASAPSLHGLPPALILAAGGRRIAASCDSLIGEEEVVVKPLGSLVGAGRYLGGTILGDGRIALLLEPAALVRGPRGIQTPAAAVADASQKILVVEDSFTVRELQRSILEAAGFRVVTARDGNDALAVLAREADIGLVLTDLEMPELDGFDLTRAIRSQPSLAALPIVVVTSLGSEDDQQRGIEAGADAYMTKQGFDQRTLLDTIERLIGPQ
jgi:two-component system, chemotaxis family, sensor kinase CheA